MNKSDLVNLLNSLLTLNISDNTDSDISVDFETKYQEACSKLNVTYEDLVSNLKNIETHYFSDHNLSEWKYLLCSFYILLKIGDIVENSGNTELLSVKEIKVIKTSIAQLTKLGIYTKLQPKLPFYVNETYTKATDIFFHYNILKCTVLAYCEFLKNSHLRVLFLTESLRAILTGLYQIAYCPLSKNIDSTFTQEIYDILLRDKDMAILLINKLRESIFPIIFVKETMIVFRHNSPPWFKKKVSQTLTTIMFSQNGIRNISVAMMDGTENDKTTTWKALDIIYRLILSSKKHLDFRKNICKQIVNLIDDTSDNSAILERLFVLCTKNFYLEDKELSKDIFVRKVLTDLLQFTYKDYKFKEGDITGRITKSIRIIHAIFIEKTVESPTLPIDILKPLIGVIFQLYTLTLNTEFKELNSESKEILIRYLTEIPREDSIIFDNFLFGINEPNQILPLRNDITLDIKNGNIKLEIPEHSVVVSVSENSESILLLLKNNTKILTRFFGYLLQCLSMREKYFRRSNDELLSTETEIMNEYFERKLVTYKLLSDLADDKNIQKQIINSPEEIISFIKDVTERTIKTNMHLTREFESDGFQTIFTVIMILHALVTSQPNRNLKDFKILEEPLKTIKEETRHAELFELIEKILYCIEVCDRKTQRMPIEEIQSKSELDIILEDICDPLLPVRGHGLMALKKLVEKKDPLVMEKKQYILTIFKQTLKNDDSFIYLNAIDGLASMGDVFPDSVIKILCEEYSDFEKKDDRGHEVRIKLGEVLVRVTKMLGDMAPTYKALLLNTFLNGTKDEDHLVRASSLSNLGEICRVLGYKLGTIVTEVLVCVHAIITTDKAIEARRAAVTVIRQLLTGLESEMISFLKEDILPVYRTLKQIYLNDKDDVMRLQAQLALEELNENMKTFVFPTPQINMDKKIIMLN